MNSTSRLLLSVSLACVATGVQAQMGATTRSPTQTANPAATPAAVAPPPLVAPSLQASNPFDPQRKVWPDRVPLPPPPPPPPPPTPITDQDLQVYGVVIAGPVKRATVKVGRRFAQLAPEGRPFANLSEGQPVGEFTLSKIEPTHLVLQARGGQQLVYFTKKTDRNAGASPPVAAAAPVQGASAADATASPTGTAPASTVASADNAPPAATTHPSPGNAAAGSIAVNNHSGAGNTTAATAANNTAGTEVNVANSLAAALAAVKINPGQRTNVPFVNPFSNLAR